MTDAAILSFNAALHNRATTVGVMGDRRRLLRGFCFLLILFVFANRATAEDLLTPPDSHFPLKRQIANAALLYFRENAHPLTGLVRDAAENFGPTRNTNTLASMASTGFGIAVMANAANRGMLDRSQARDYVRNVLRFSSQNVTRYKGWFPHFVNWQTGERVAKSEYSTIDTALFIAGALYAAAVFHEDPEIDKLANALYEQMDFHDFLTDGGRRPKKLTLSMAYGEERGYTDGQWDMYAEQKILLILGFGHPTRPLPAAAWLAWSRKPVRGSDSQRLMGLDEALFVHQYSELFLDLRNLRDGFPNYFENSRRVSLYHRNMMRRHPRYKTLRAGFWGFSAGEAPHEEYQVYDGLENISTVCIGCSLASVVFIPNEVLADAANWLDGPYGRQIWGRYGFVDSLDIDQQWFAHKALGTTVGAIFLSFANLDEATSVWKTFMGRGDVQHAFARISHHGEARRFERRARASFLR